MEGKRSRKFSKVLNFEIRYAAGQDTAVDLQKSLFNNTEFEWQTDKC